MHLDRYSMSCREPKEAVISKLCEAFGSGCEVIERKPLKSYAEAVSFVVGGLVVAWADFGGFSNGWNHIEASGDHTRQFVPIVRRLFPGHRVTRVDACLDFEAPDAWGRLSELLLQFGISAGLKLFRIGDYDRGVDGRTLYLGSRKSAVFVRLYEKGRQLGAHLLDPARAGWVRLEIQVRPLHDARYRAASLSAEEVWGLSRWTRNLLAAVTGLCVPRVTMSEHRIPDCDRAVFWMAKQFAGSIHTFCDLHGFTREDFSRKLWELIDLDDRQKERSRKIRDAA